MTNANVEEDSDSENDSDLKDDEDGSKYDEDYYGKGEIREKFAANRNGEELSNTKKRAEKCRGGGTMTTAPI